MTLIPHSHKAFTKARKKLTLDVFDYAEQETKVFRNYVEVPGGIYAPRDYAAKLGLYPHNVAEGFSLEDDCLQPVKLRDEQVPFVDAIMRLAEGTYQYDSRGFADIRAEAATGKGKTVMALEVCRRLQLTTLIIVDQEFLRDQWIERATELFQVPEEEIGLVQGKTEDWYGKSIVIGMIQSLHSREMPEEFWNYFGLTVFDESHTVGAKKFSRVLNNTASVIRLGVSATSKRGDELDKVIEASLGEVQIHLEAEHAKSRLYYVEYDKQSFSWYANKSAKSGRFISEIAGDGERNLMIAEIIENLYERDHHVLAISDRVEQCEDVALLLYNMGIPEEDIGVVTGFKTEWRYAKNDNPKRKPYGYVRKSDYTPIKLQRVRRRANAAELNHAKDNARIVLATYGKFEKGVDVPRLSAGIDMTPRSKAVQVHGRILREHKGKRMPVWVTICDIQSYRSIHQFANRIGEYVKSNAEVYKWQLGEQPVKQHANRVAADARLLSQRLKSGNITAKPNGNFIATVPSTVRKSSKRRDAPTGKTTLSDLTRSRKASR